MGIEQTKVLPVQWNQVYFTKSDSINISSQYQKYFFSISKIFVFSIKNIFSLSGWSAETELKLNNLFKLSNLIDRFFIRIKHNKNDRIGSSNFSTKMKMSKIAKYIRTIKPTKKWKWKAMKHTKRDTIKSTSAMKQKGKSRHNMKQ